MVGAILHPEGFLQSILKSVFSSILIFKPEIDSLLEFLLSSLQNGSIFTDFQEENERSYMKYSSN